MSLDFQESFQASEQDENSRLDLLLKSKFPEYSRSYFQYLIENGHITINGKPAKKRSLLQEGQLVDVNFIAKEILKAKPEDLPLELLYEDEDIIAINKPRNQVVHPAPGHSSKTLVNALLHHFHNLIRLDDLRPGIVHRLDKDTSGVILVAKNQKAHEKLSNAFKDRSMKKTYLALCLGHPKDQIVEGAIGRNPHDRKAMSIQDGGKEAVSKITTLKHKEGYSLVQIEPLTGRTHQIRVHLQSLGCPVLGDPLYGAKKLNDRLNIERQLLHAHKIAFKHPISGVSLEIVAEMPEDMKVFENRLL
ncbi:MAG: Ribosomal large subunit pseudouridine synthase D [Chlamydiia bacterium]|nr:Ribosomal large subunit pseudouridine synthase D [Chlamydiia bacterium]